MLRLVQIVSLGFAFLFFSESSFSEVHPLKMSFSKLVISPEGFVDLKTRIFLDDITAQIQLLYNLDSIDFSSVDSEATKALQLYLENHFFLEQEGIKSELQIQAVSFSKNGLALALDMSTDKPLNPAKELYLTNTLLCDADPKQKNDIIYREKHIRLNSTNPTEQILID